MVEVGLLAALVSIVIVLAVTLTDRAVSRIIRSFATARLCATSRAPVVHDADTWLLNIPFTIFKFRRYPAIFFTILCYVLLILSEIFTELGVTDSNLCSLNITSGTLIKSGNVSERVTDAELAASAFFMQHLNFYEGRVQSVPSGVPKNVNPATCLSCLSTEQHFRRQRRLKEDRRRYLYPQSLDGSNDAQPINHRDSEPEKPILANCIVEEGEPFLEGTLEIGVNTTKQAFGTITVGFREPNPCNGPCKVYTGNGDLTNNSYHAATFLVYSDPNDQENASGASLTYFEYADAEHCKSLLKDAGKAYGEENTTKTIWNKTRARVFRHTITCKENQLSVARFRLGVQVFRTMQLESTGQQLGFDDTLQRFNPPTPEDIYRAVMAMKIIDQSKDNDDKPGLVYEYTTCGKFRVRFLIPFMAMFAVIALLFAASTWSSRKVARRVRIPHSARGWYQQLDGREGLPVSIGAYGRSRRRTRHWSPFGRLDELVLVRDVEQDALYVMYAGNRAAATEQSDDLISATSSDYMQTGDFYVAAE